MGHPPEEDLEHALSLLIDENSGDERKECLLYLHQRLEKLLNKPEKKVRKINITKEAFQNNVACRSGGIGFLQACGFELGGGEHLVLSEENEDKLHLMKARRFLRTRAVEEAGLTEDELNTPSPDKEIVTAPYADDDLLFKFEPAPAIFDVSMVSTPFDIVDFSASPKAKPREKPPVKPPVKPAEIKRHKSLSEEERIVLIDAEFFQFSNGILRPGGECHKETIAQAFCKVIHPKWKPWAHDASYDVSEHDAEEVMARWNAKYARVPMNPDGFYVGLHIYVAPPVEKPKPIVLHVADVAPIKKGIKKKKKKIIVESSSEEDDEYEEEEEEEEEEEVPSTSKRKPKKKKNPIVKGKQLESGSNHEGKPKRKVVKKKKSLDGSGEQIESGSDHEVAPVKKGIKKKKKKEITVESSSNEEDDGYEEEEEEETPSTSKLKPKKKKSPIIKGKQLDSGANHEGKPKKKPDKKKSFASESDEDQPTRRRVLKKKTGVGPAPDGERKLKKKVPGANDEIKPRKKKVQKDP